MSASLPGSLSSGLAMPRVYHADANSSARDLGLARITPDNTVSQSRVNNANQWAAVNDLVHQLYIVEKKELKEVRRIMQTCYDFKRTEQQYKKRFRSWGLRKYKRKVDTRHQAEERSIGNGNEHGMIELDQHGSFANAPQYGPLGVLVAARKFNVPAADDSPAWVYSMSRHTTVPTGHERLEGALSAVQGNFKRGVHLGLWSAADRAEYVVSYKGAICRASVLNIRSDIQLASNSLSMASTDLNGEHTKIGMMYVSRVCHNFKSLLQAQVFGTAPLLIYLAYILAHHASLYIGLYAQVMQHVSNLAQKLHGNQHPLAVLAAYFAADTFCENQNEMYQTFNLMLRDCYNHSLGITHAQTLFEMLSFQEQTGVVDKHNVRGILRACDEEHGRTSEQSLYCLSILVKCCLKQQDTDEADEMISEISRRAMTIIDQDRATPWNFRLAICKGMLAYAMQDWNTVEILLRKHILPTVIRCEGPCSGRAMQCRDQLIEVLQLQEKHDEAAKVWRKTNELYARITYEIYTP